MKFPEKLSAACYRASTVWTAIAATLLYIGFIATIMPEQSAQSAAYAGEWGAPDRHFFYTPDELYSEISRWGPAGRQDYIDFRLGLDIIWALAYTAFLVTWTSCALRLAYPDNDRRRLLNITALVTLLSDYGENALGIWLVASTENRMDTIAWLAAGSTSLKWTSLVIAHLVLLYALGSLLQRRLHTM